MKKELITVNIPGEIVAEIKKQAKEEHRSFSNMVTVILMKNGYGSKDVS